jgi:hypothetical protein
VGNFDERQWGNSVSAVSNAISVGLDAGWDVSVSVNQVNRGVGGDPVRSQHRGR